MVTVIINHHGNGARYFILQIVDDILDFKCTQSCVGKPTAVDLRLGLATAPVLYAARKVGYTLFSILH